MNLGPHREEQKLDNGRWRIVVIPPTWTGLQGSSIILNADQHRRYRAWLDGGYLIQQLLPDLSDDEREVLLTGIGSSDWDRVCSDEEDSL